MLIKPAVAEQVFGLNTMSKFQQQIEDITSSEYQYALPQRLKKNVYQMA